MSVPTTALCRRIGWGSYSNGAISKQFTKSGGTFWSYAAILATFTARYGFTPASWDTAILTVPTTSSSGSAGFTVVLAFKVQATTVYGENIYIAGFMDALKNWSPDSVLLLSSISYPTCSITVNVPAKTLISYKYIRKNNSAVTWEFDQNCSFTSPTSGMYTLNNSWR